MLIKACYILSCLAYLIVIAYSIIIMSIMIKHRTFCDTNWRVKTVLVAYPFCAMTLFIYSLVTRIFKGKVDHTPGVFIFIPCAWVLVHWEVTVYYLRTACLLKTSFNQPEAFKRRNKLMNFIEIAGISVTLCFLAVYLAYLRKITDDRLNVVWAIFSMFMAMSTSLMVIIITLSFKHIEKETKSLASTGFSINILQVKLYKIAFFLTSTSLWIYAGFQITFVARGELKTVDNTEIIYQLSFLPMALCYIFGSILDLLVLWSFYKLDKKVSAQMQERVQAKFS